MEVRIESMVCLWDDTIPKMFIEFVNLLTLATSEEQLRRSVKDFAEKDVYKRQPSRYGTTEIGQERA